VRDVFTNPEALAAIREKDGHTQRSLSKVSGVSQQHISRLEAAPVPIRPTTARKLAVALAVPISAFTHSTLPEIALSGHESSAAGEGGTARSHIPAAGAATGGAA
jgi:transcriptional regulator with XRE-family HTH domain